MQIVIKISDTLKEIIDSHDIATASHFMWVSIMMDAIENGTPLPKGHGRLIDADEIQFERTEFETYGDYCIAFDAIDQADTIIKADKAESDGKE